MTIDPALLQRFIDIVGPRHALVEPAEIEPHLREWRKRWTGRTPVVLKPASTREVSEILALATQTKTAIVPQGGNTGLVGGQMPDETNSQIILSLSRLNAIRDIDVASNTITVDAGCVLQTIQEAADGVDRLFPLSLASQGSCQIGGNLSANAGGTGALSYGVARDLVVGLEVVLPTGEILNDLSKLKKDNTGYALRHLFIGAEGTLGIITGATLKLFAKPKGYGSVFANVTSVEAALTLLQNATDALGPGLTTFELMADIAVDFADRHIEGAFWPSEDRTGWTVFMEYSSLVSDSDASQKIEAVFEHAFTKGLITDGAMAQNAKQRQALWMLRESLSEAQGFEGHSIKHDISVPVSSVPAFVAQAAKDVRDISPDARICAFGHMGDGNLHYNISQPEGGDTDAFKALAPAITEAVHQRVVSFGGSISAEHGIGQMKRDELAATKDPVALSLMRRIKRDFDPANIMNPGKVIDP